MKVLATGSRNWQTYQPIKDVILDLYCTYDGKISFSHGGCRGVDAIVDMVCDELNIYCVVYPAEWDKYGRKAGILRNKEMFDIEKPDLVIAFHEDLFGRSRGTLHMVQYAHENGCEVRLYQKEY